MSQDRAIVINKQWAGVLTACLAALIIGGVSYAWAANAKDAVLQRDVAELKQANLDVRLARMEEKIDWLVKVELQTQKRRD